jgi:hypothetical protein
LWLLGWLLVMVIERLLLRSLYVYLHVATIEVE